MEFEKSSDSWTGCYTREIDYESYFITNWSQIRDTDDKSNKFTVMDCNSLGLNKRDSGFIIISKNAMLFANSGQTCLRKGNSLKAMS